MHGLPASRARMNLLNSVWASRVQSPRVLSLISLTASALRSLICATFSALPRFDTASVNAHPGEQTLAIGIIGVNLLQQTLHVFCFGMRITLCLGARIALRLSCLMRTATGQKFHANTRRCKPAPALPSPMPGTAKQSKPKRVVQPAQQRAPICVSLRCCPWPYTRMSSQ